MRTSAILLLLAVVLAVGCTTTATSTAPAKSGAIWVRGISLEPLRGEVGKPYQGHVAWESNYIRDPEVAVTGLPPGLVYDPATRTVIGKPGRAGFFTVNVGVRKHVSPDPRHRPAPDERWWPAKFQLEIYTPLRD